MYRELYERSIGLKTKAICWHVTFGRPGPKCPLCVNNVLGWKTNSGVEHFYEAVILNIVKGHKQNMRFLCFAFWTGLRIYMILERYSTIPVIFDSLSARVGVKAHYSVLYIKSLNFKREV